MSIIRNGTNITFEGVVGDKVNRSGDNMTGVLRISSIVGAYPVLDINSSGSVNPLFRITNSALSGSDRGSGFIVGHDDGSASSAGDRLGYNLFFGTRGGTNSKTNAAGISVFANQTWNLTSSPTHIDFEVTPVGSTARGKVMTIEPTGNLKLYKDGKGISMDAPDGGHWCVTVSNLGILTTTSGFCT